MREIKSQIEEVEKKMIELEQKNIEIIKKQFGSYWRQKNNSWKKPYSDYGLLQAKLQTLKSLEPLFEKMDKEIKELNQMYELRNDDAKDYSKVLIQKENEIKELKKKLDDFKKEIDEMMSDDDCNGYKEHKTLTLNTVYRYPIEDPKTQEMKRLKDFAMGCFREGWIFALTEIQKLFGAGGSE